MLVVCGVAYFFHCLLKYNVVFKNRIECCQSCSKKSPATHYFAQRDPDETIFESITRLNILPNQFYAALAVFTASKRWGTEPPKFSFGGGYSLPPPPCPPCSAASGLLYYMTRVRFDSGSLAVMVTLFALIHIRSWPVSVAYCYTAGNEHSFSFLEMWRNTPQKSPFKVLFHVDYNLSRYSSFGWWLPYFHPDNYKFNRSFKDPFFGNAFNNHFLKSTFGSNRSWSKCWADSWRLR